MGRFDEIVSEQFSKWEERGRGWRVFPNPIDLEPPFRPFRGFLLPSDPDVDDGRKPRFLASIFDGIHRQLNPCPPVTPETPEEPEPEVLERGPCVELQVSLPPDLEVPREGFDHFLSNLSLCNEPIAFEILGLPKRVTVQFAASPADVPKVQRQVQAHFPEVIAYSRKDTLPTAWETCQGRWVFVLEFGLKNPFMLPLDIGKPDPFVGIIGALGQLHEGDLGLFQVLFQPVSHPWNESIKYSVSHGDGKPLFVNAPELTKAAEKKISERLYAVVIRVATKGQTYDRAFEIARDIACALTVFAHPQGNELIPLSNEDYDIDDHVVDMLSRQTRRSGMILNADELIGFVHLPSRAVQSSALVRQSGKTKAAPVTAQNGVLIGNNIHLEKEISVRLSSEQRVRHTHIVGASGTGKSTLLFNLIRQDIENGEGVAVLDPHGDLIDKILTTVPPERIPDVVLVDPSDEKCAIPFNILNAHSELEKTLIASDLTAVFHRLSSSWGDQMQSVLQNAILAFLESSRGGTLADLRRFLIEPTFRADFLKTVHDPNVLYYWQKGFVHLSGNKSIGPVLTRLEMFLSKKPILHMVAQPENRLDFGEIMDSGKIFLAKLPEGLLGKENSYLLGALLISKFQQLAMSRQAMQIDARRDFWIYLDEFHNFITPSMGEILSGARKYRMGLTLAHHELRQLQRDAEVASAVLSHPCTRICFRLGDEDARKLADGFSFFEARDLQNLGVGEAIARIERSDADFNLTVPLPEPVNTAEAFQRRKAIIAASREKYGTLRSKVDADLLRLWATEPPEKPARSHLQISHPAPVLVPSPPARPPAIAIIPAEVPKITEPEKAASRPAPSLTELPKLPMPITSVPTPIAEKVEKPRDLGRGGAQHKAIQKRLKREAHALHFHSTIEKQIADGKFVDLWLERNGQVIACEIALGNTIDWEVGNILKCLEAGCPKVALICLSEERLRKIELAVSGSLGAEFSTRVQYFQPDQFIAFLKSVPAEIPKEQTTVRCGYKIKRVHSELSTAEQAEKEAAAIRAIAEAMRKKK